MEVASCVSLRCVTEPFVVAHNSALLHSMTTTKPPIINTTDTPEIIQIQVRVFSIKLNPPLTPNSQMETFTSSDAPSEAVTASDQIKTNSYVWRHVIFVVYVLSGFPSVGVVRVGEIQVQEESLRIWDLRPEASGVLVDGPMVVQWCSCSCYGSWALSVVIDHTTFKLWWALYLCRSISHELTSSVSYFWLASFFERC